MEMKKYKNPNLNHNFAPRTLARDQSCGCIVCFCEEEQCQNCGAKNCGTHDVGKIPNPIYVEWDVGEDNE